MKKTKHSTTMWGWVHCWSDVDEAVHEDALGHTLGPLQSLSSPKHPASDCLNIPFLKPSISQRARPQLRPSRLPNHPADFPFACNTSDVHARCCVTAVCSVPASAAPLHPSLLWNEERARLGGRSVPLPVSLFRSTPLASHHDRYRVKLTFYSSQVQKDV